MFRSELLQAWRVVLEGFEGGASRFALSGDDSGQELCDQIPEVSSDGSIYNLDFIGMVSFEIDIARRRITGRRISPKLTSESLAHALDDHCAPRILAHEGRLVLHGSGVLLDGKLAIFLGETGAGKSTLAASFEQAGHHLLGDDAIVVSDHDDHFYGEATYRSLRLFPHSVSAIYGDGAATSPMAHYSTKVHVEPRAPAVNFEGQSPVAAVFCLDTNYEASAVEARLLVPREACLRLLAQSFALDPQDSDHALRRLTQISRLVTQVPVYELSYPRDFAALPHVHATIQRLINEARQNTLAVR